MKSINFSYKSAFNSLEQMFRVVTTSMNPSTPLCRKELKRSKKNF